MIKTNARQGITDAILATFPGTNTGIVGHDAMVSRSIPAAYSGYDPSYGPSYEAHYSRIVPRLDRWLGLPLGHVAHVWDIMTEEELLRSEYYNDWLRPQEQVRADQTCRLPMSVPGVGALTSLAYVSTIEDSRRFSWFRAVDAHLSLTPREVQSGEMDGGFLATYR